jgi:hypothetical protein
MIILRVLSLSHVGQAVDQGNGIFYEDCHPGRVVTTALTSF